MRNMHVVLTFSVITEAHLGLAKTNCVFPLTDAIKLLKLGLVNTLERGVSKIVTQARGRLNALSQSILIVPDLENISQWL